MTHVVGVIRQWTFRFRNDDDSEAAATWKAAGDVDVEVAPDENVRLRIAAQETAGGSTTRAFKLQYSLNGGTFTDVNASSSVVRCSASPHVAEDADTTDQIGGSGTFVGTGGFDEVDGRTSTANMAFAANGHGEVEFCFQVLSADVADNDTIDFRIVDVTGTVLDGGYAIIPRLTVNETPPSGDTPTPGGGVAGGNAPVASAQATAGGALGDGAAPGGSGPVGVGGADAAGQGPTDGRAAIAAGGAPAAGVAPVASGPVDVGGAPAAGLAPQPGTPVTPGGALAAGLGPTVVLVELVIGGAIAGGNAPVDGESETPTPGGALAAGLGPQALVDVDRGGAEAGGTGPASSGPVDVGGALAGGTGPTVFVALVPGGALAAGFGPAALAQMVAGGAIARGFPPFDPSLAYVVVFGIYDRALGGALLSDRSLKPAAGGISDALVGGLALGDKRA